MTCSNAVQGVAGATGLGAVIVGVQPLFAAIKWAGIVYLAFLAVQALRSAAAGRYLPFDHEKLVHQFGRGLAARVRIQHHQPQDACLLPRCAAPVPRPHPSLPALVALGLSHAALLRSTFSLSSPVLREPAAYPPAGPCVAHSMP